MRERLDCATLFTLRAHRWPRMHTLIGNIGQLHLEPLCPDVDPNDPASVQVLMRNAVNLRRFDTCIIAVTRADLPWIRTALSVASGHLQTPLLVLALGLSPCAINDLYQLGVDDFIRSPCGLDELHLRVRRLLNLSLRNATPRAEATALQESPRSYAPRPDAVRLPLPSICATIRDRSVDGLAEFAIVSASRDTAERQSFRDAKQRLIERFERAYIVAALRRHSGNVAQAARFAQKHRRAFWELMRKHKIDVNGLRPKQCSTNLRGINLRGTNRRSTNLRT